MERKLRTYNCAEPIYRKAMRRARLSDKSLAQLVQGFVIALGDNNIAPTEIDYYFNQLPEKKKVK
jgi:hypothetical protein